MTNTLTNLLDLAAGILIALPLFVLSWLLRHGDREHQRWRREMAEQAARDWRRLMRVAA